MSILISLKRGPLLQLTQDGDNVGVQRVQMLDKRLFFL